MKKEHLEWAAKHFPAHLQGAVDLELWTIPYYMSAMYSIKDRNSEAYQLLRSVINQEMLHLQCAANIANAYGLSPTITAPSYDKNKIPHLNMSFNPSKDTEPYTHHSFQIGPLDEERINGMCLVELPDYGVTDQQLILETLIDQYSSIGAFYKALRYGALALKDEIKGGIKQVDAFSAFYRNIPSMVITESATTGYDQVNLLIDLITDQGEGENKDQKDIEIPTVFQNTADDTHPEMDHFEKFNLIKDYPKGLPETYTVKAPGDYTDEDRKLEQILIQQFGQLTGLLQALFNGENPQNFFPVMAGVGAAITNCWKHGVTPKYSETNQL